MFGKMFILEITNLEKVDSEVEKVKILIRMMTNVFTSALEELDAIKQLLLSSRSFQGEMLYDFGGKVCF